MNTNTKFGQQILQIKTRIKKKIWVFQNLVIFSVFFLFLGFVFGNLFGTFLEFFRNFFNWDALILALIIFFIEFINYLTYTKKKLLKFSKKKIGVRQLGLNLGMTCRESPGCAACPNLDQTSVETWVRPSYGRLSSFWKPAWKKLAAQLSCGAFFPKLQSQPVGSALQVAAAWLNPSFLRVFSKASDPSSETGASSEVENSAAAGRKLGFNQAAAAWSPVPGAGQSGDPSSVAGWVRPVAKADAALQSLTKSPFQKWKTELLKRTKKNWPQSYLLGKSLKFTSKVKKKPYFLKLLNFYKIGLLLGFFIDAFKVGS